MGGENYKRLSISLPGDLFEQFDDLRMGLKMSRSDAIRKAMNLFIIDNESKTEKFLNKRVVATIVYVEHSHVHGHPPEQTAFHGNHSHAHSHSNEYREDGTDTEERNGQPETAAADREAGGKESGRRSDAKRKNDKGSSSNVYYVPIEQIEYLQATELQHDYLDVIQSTLHIHINADSCMEIVACKGPYERIHALYMNIQKLKTIKKIELNIMDIIG